MTRPSPQTDRVVALIDLLAARPDAGVGLGELSRRLGIHKQTCHSMLTALLDAGWLVRHPADKTYRLGPTLTAIGRAASHDLPILDFAHRSMQDLARRNDLACLALMPSGDHIVVVDGVSRGRLPTAVHIGQQFHLRAPFGAVFVAWSGDDAIDAWANGEATDETTSIRLRSWLATVRTRGFDVRQLAGDVDDIIAEIRRMMDATPSRGDHTVEEVVRRLTDEFARRRDQSLLSIRANERYTVHAIEAPVFDHDGRVVLSISLTGLTEPVAGREVNRLAALLTAATKELTAALHGQPPRSVARRARGRTV